MWGNYVKIFEGLSEIPGTSPYVGELQLRSQDDSDAIRNIPLCGGITLKSLR